MWLVMFKIFTFDKMLLIFMIMFTSFNMAEEFLGLEFACPLYSCVNSCDHQDDNLHQPCACDNYCVSLGDCCRDYYTVCNSFSKEHELYNFILRKGPDSIPKNQKEELAKFAKLSSCNQISVDVDGLRMISYIRSIATCPSEYMNADIKKKCEHRREAFPVDIPVSLRAVPYVVYQNVFCAVCNNVDISSGIQYWQANITCHLDRQTTVTTFQQLGEQSPDQCTTLLTIPSDTKVRYCKNTSDIRTCATVLISGNDAPDNHRLPEPNVRKESTSTVGDEASNRTELNSVQNSSVTVEHSSTILNNEPLISGNVTNEKGFSMSRNVSDSTTDSEVDISDDAKTPLNLSTVCDSYFFLYVDDNDVKYKNPHCYACAQGWKDIKNISDTDMRCKLASFGSTFIKFSPENFKIVNYSFGLYQKRFIFYSSELDRTLDSFLPNCGFYGDYDMISQSCKTTICSQGLVPYYEICLKKELLHVRSNINTDISGSIYVTIDGELYTLTEDYNALVQETMLSLTQMGIEKARLDNTFSLDYIERGIKLTSFEIIKPGYQIQEETEEGILNILFPVSVQVKITVPVLFNETKMALLDLSSLPLSKTPLRIKNLTIRNYDINAPADCNSGTRREYRNIPIVYIGRHAFVEINGELLDIDNAMVTLEETTNSSWKVTSLKYCGSNILQEETTLVALESTVSAMPPPELPSCNRTIKVSREIFENAYGSIDVSGGRMTVSGKYVIVCWDLLNQQGVLLQIQFKRVTVISSIILKILAIFVRIIKTYQLRNNVYVYILPLTISLIDVVHILEAFTNMSSPIILPVILHFVWLLTFYICAASCYTNISGKPRNPVSSLCQHLLTSLVVPVTTVAICATGDINNPPWNIGYGTNNHIFSIRQNIFVYSYIIPMSLAVAVTIICYLYGQVRLKINSNGEMITPYVIMILLTVQFILGCLEILEGNSVFGYLYYTASVIVSCAILFFSVTVKRNLQSDN